MFPSALRGPVSREKISRGNWPREVDERFKETPAVWRPGAFAKARSSETNGQTSKFFLDFYLCRNRLPLFSFRNVLSPRHFSLFFLPISYVRSPLTRVCTSSRISRLERGKSVALRAHEHRRKSIIASDDPRERAINARTP